MSNTRHVREIQGGQFKRPRRKWGQGRARFAGIGLTKAQQDSIIERTHLRVNKIMSRITVAGTFPIHKQGDR